MKKDGGGNEILFSLNFEMLYIGCHNNKALQNCSSCGGNYSPLVPICKLNDTFFLLKNHNLEIKEYMRTRATNVND